MGKFVLKSKQPLVDVVELEESDFSVVNKDGDFMQFTYKPDENEGIVPLDPGIYSIAVIDHALAAKKTSFNLSANVMTEYIHTKDISDKIDAFFNKLDVYEQYKIFPKRGILLHGPQGTGKSLTISKTIEKYAKGDDTVILYWPTDKFRASDVKAFLKDIVYADTVKKFIFIIEDIGGVSIDSGGQKLAVEPSLLSILDNMESIFKIPTMILATTNFPENLLANIANRPKRFDYLHNVGNPTAEFRSKFLEFFSQGKATEEEKALIANKKFDAFSVAHIEEVVIRHSLEDIEIKQSMEDVLKQSNYSTAGFTDPKKGMGF